MANPESGQPPVDSTADSTSQIEQASQEWESSPRTEPDLAVDRRARHLQDGPDGATADESKEAERIAQRPDF